MTQSVEFIFVKLELKLYLEDHFSPPWSVFYIIQHQCCFILPKIVQCLV